MAKNNKRKIPKEPIHKEIEKITIRAIQPFYNRFSYPLAESNSNVNGAKLLPDFGSLDAIQGL